MSEIEDVGDSPFANETSWKGGVSANPNGRPKGVKNAKPRSKMRSTLTKLYTLEKDAVDIIRDSLKVKKDAEGNKVETDKTQLDTAKFVIKAIESFNNTCLREEMAIVGIRAKDDNAANELEENQSVASEPAVNTGNFSMDMVESNLKH
jgi:hypothetical protein